MVDVSEKAVTAREAIARGRSRCRPRRSRHARAGEIKKGDPLETARLAGIMAAKQTAALIPLCHPLPMSHVDVQLTPARGGYEIEARVRTTAQTGVEMEALTAVSVAALTVYDMVKAVDKANGDRRDPADQEDWRQVGDVEAQSLRPNPRLSVLGANISAVTLPAAEPAPQLATIADLPFHVSGRHPKPLLVGRVRDGKIVGDSTKEWFERLRDLSLGLRALGVGPGDRVAIISESRPEWLLTDLALLVYGAVSVPVYPTLSAAQARFILADSGARIAFVSSQEQLEKVQRIRHELPAIEAIVVFDELTSPSPSVLPFASVIERGHAQLLEQWGVGRTFRDDARKVKPSDLAAIIYTSGTTGEPKGAMLTHGNLASNLLAAQTILRLDDEEVALSFLPLSHAFERMLAYVGLFNGVTIVFAESLETVARDILTVRPTLMTGVPRVYEKFEARIRQKGDSLPQPRRTLFHWGQRRGDAREGGDERRPALGSAEARSRACRAAGLVEDSGERRRPPSYDDFRQCAAAARSRRVLYGIGLPITEGYGLTETAPVLTGNPPARSRRHRRPRNSWRRDPNRSRRRNPRPRAERHDRLLSQAR